MRNEELRKELLRMHTVDDRTRDELVNADSLHVDYHPKIEAVHRENGNRLVQIMEEFGWPGRSLVGEAGMRAAWRIAQHAISLPEVQRRALVLLTDAVGRGDAPPWQAAFLEDRIRVCEGKPQRYGTQFDWDENSRMSPCPIEDPNHVDDRRNSVGLRPLEQEVHVSRTAITQSGEKAPADYHERRRRREEWARSVGWQQ